LLARIPAEYCLGKGHVMFFMDKGWFLMVRHRLIGLELERRGVAFQPARLDPSGAFAVAGKPFIRNYTPTPAALALNRARIAERIAARPGWYRMNGELI
jgi:deoxyribonuclease (pyrimidine dimer)